jgi:hypothetical protein
VRSGLLPATLAQERPPRRVLPRGDSLQARYFESGFLKAELPERKAIDENPSFVAG